MAPSTTTRTVRQQAELNNLECLYDAGPFTADRERALLREKYQAPVAECRADLDDSIRQSNVSSVEETLEIVNHGETPDVYEITGCWKMCCGGLVEPRAVRLVDNYGTTLAVGPGRYWLYPRVSWIGEFSFTDDFYCETPIAMIRPPAGQYGKAMLDNRPIFIVSEDGNPFVVNNPNFVFEGFVARKQTYIQHETLHVLQVPKGQVAKVSDRDVPAILPEGFHVFRSSTFKFDGFASLGDEYFQVGGTINRFCVRHGYIGVAWVENTPIFFEEPGVYYVESALFEWHGCVKAFEQVLTLGSKKIITVMEEEVGVSYDRGQLVILEPGRHYIDSERHSFAEFLTMQQQCLPLRRSGQQDGARRGSRSSGGGGRRTSASPELRPSRRGQAAPVNSQFGSSVGDDLMVCESAEMIPIGVSATVFYHIEDAHTAVKRMGSLPVIENFINENSIALLTVVIRQTQLTDMSKKASGEAADSKEKKQSFFDTVRTEFVSQMQDKYREDYGIMLESIRIGDFKVLDAEKATAIASQAKLTADTQANVANLTGRRKVEQFNNQTKQMMDRIDAEVRAYRAEQRSKAEADGVKELAAAKAEALTIEAGADATAIRLVAEAEAFKVKATGEAESHRAQLMQANPFGQEVAFAELQVELARATMVNKEGIAYLPLDEEDNPYSIFVDPMRNRYRLSAPRSTYYPSQRSSHVRALPSDSDDDEDVFTRKPFDTPNEMPDSARSSASRHRDACSDSYELQ